MAPLLPNTPAVPCPHFVDDRYCRCRAVSGHVVPSLHERELFCRSDCSQDCPTMRAFLAHGAPIPEETYYLLWTSPRAGRSQPEPAASNHFTP